MGAGIDRTPQCALHVPLVSPDGHVVAGVELFPFTILERDNLSPDSLVATVSDSGFPLVWLRAITTHGKVVLIDKALVARVN